MDRTKHAILLIEDDLSVNCQYDSSLKDKLSKLIPHCTIAKFPSGQLTLSSLRNTISTTFKNKDRIVTYSTAANFDNDITSTNTSTKTANVKIPFDFLISDLNLIDMSAEELVDQISKLNIKIKIILIAEDELLCLQARTKFTNGEKILAKPLHMSDLIALIEGDWESFQYDDADNKGDLVPVRLTYLQDEHAYPFDLFISLNSDKRIKIFHGDEFVDLKRLDKLTLKGVRFLYAKKSDILKIKHKMYLPIRTSTLIQQEILPFTVYVDDFSPLFRNGHMITTSDLTRLKKMKVTQLFIEDRDEIRYQKYLDKKINKFIDDKEIEIIEKSEVLSSYLNNRVQNIITNPTHENLEPLIIAQKHFQTFLSKESNSLKAMISVLKSDTQNIYNHSISVATICYAVTLEMVEMRKNAEHHKKVRSLDEMDLESEESLNILFIGALLHDIGKAIMYFNTWAQNFNKKRSDKNDNKSNRNDKSDNNDKTDKIATSSAHTSYNENEDDSMSIPDAYLRMHPQLGYDTLKKIKGIHPNILEIVLQHEEYCDGSGYPKGLSKNFISNYTQLITLANYYDNIMRLSSTLKTINKERAIANMEQNIAKFNKAFFHAFKTLFLRTNI